MTLHLRIARPVADPARSASLYCAGLGMSVLGSFTDHDGFSGAMAGMPGGSYHLEFTRALHHPITPAPTDEDLLVFYVPGRAEWVERCARLLAAGFREVGACNPYWDRLGTTYVDPDGYRVVLQNAAWKGGPGS